MQFFQTCACETFDRPEAGRRGREAPGRPTAWSRDELPDYSSVAPQLPMLEESMTQIEAGEFRAGASIITADDVTLYLARVVPRAVGVSVLKSTHIAFAVPISWKGEYRINGMTADPAAMYLPDSGRYCHIVGRDRATFGVLVRRDRFIETVAALRGVSCDDVTLDGDPMVMPPSAAARLRQRLAGILARESGTSNCAASGGERSRFADEVFGLMTDTYLLARPEKPCVFNYPLKPDRIVRKAEERFVAAGGRPVSLADLCAAAGVSKSALYAAFQSVCGVPPLAYFRKRRLMQARSLLLQSGPCLGAVKYAALENGFTELGRFSLEYRRLFGEHPSATLNHHSAEAQERVS